MKYKINDIAKLLGVTTNTIRRYEAAGFISPERDESDYRRYSGYDIVKASMIRLYAKCGFSQSEIKNMLNNSDSSIYDLCCQRLNEMDEEIERMKLLRHWLKDNIYMMRTAEVMGEHYLMMDCPRLKYVIYCYGEHIYTEPQRLEVINKFMYNMPEVQFLQFYKEEDLKKGNVIACCGWAIKFMDISRFKLSEKDFENPFIEEYPSIKSLYGVLKISNDKVNDIEYCKKLRLDYYIKAQEMIERNGLVQDGDMVEIIVSFFGNEKTSFIYIPVKASNTDRKE